MEVLVQLIRDASTIEQAQRLLKEVSLPFSAGGWEEFLDKRLWPAIKNKKISEARLIEFLAEQEEYGSQHVFLYKRPQKQLPSEAEVEAWAQAVGAIGALATPRVLDKPAQRTIAEVRREETKYSNNLVIKTVETRSSEKKTSENVEGPIRTVTYVTEQTRAVNVVCFRNNGTLEVRIARHRTGRTDYSDARKAMLNLVLLLFPAANHVPVPLYKAKRYLWDDRAVLTPRIRYSNQEMRDDQGRTMRLATGAQSADLFDSTRVTGAGELFLGEDEAFIESFNVWWKEQPSTKVPESDTHVLISGEPNEFAITQQCSRATYEHILQDLRKFNI